MKTPPLSRSSLLIAILGLCVTACAGDGGPAVPPSLTISPLELDFGAVPIDVPATREITLTNDGGGEIALLSLTLTEGDPDNWIVDRNDLDLLGAGASGTVLVTFDPREQRSYTGQLQIRTDAPSSGARSGG